MCFCMLLRGQYPLKCFSVLNNLECKIVWIAMIDCIRDNLVVFINCQTACLNKISSQKAHD